MDILQSENVRQLRGVILQMVYDNHRKQQSHLSAVVLAGALDRLHFDFPLNDLLTVLQDLKERGCLHFVQEKDRFSGRISIQRISITPGGRDLVEGTIRNAAVQFD